MYPNYPNYQNNPGYQNPPPQSPVMPNSAPNGVYVVPPKSSASKQITGYIIALASIWAVAVIAVVLMFVFRPTAKSAVPDSAANIILDVSAAAGSAGTPITPTDAYGKQRDGELGNLASDDSSTKDGSALVAGYTYTAGDAGSGDVAVQSAPDSTSATIATYGGGLIVEPVDGIVKNGFTNVYYLSGNTLNQGWVNVPSLTFSSLASVSGGYLMAPGTYSGSTVYRIKAAQGTSVYADENTATASGTLADGTLAEAVDGVIKNGRLSVLYVKSGSVCQGWVDASALTYFSSAPISTYYVWSGDVRLPAGSTYAVSGTNNKGLNLRDDGSMSANVLTVLPEGTYVQPVDGVVKNNFTRVWCSVNGQIYEGWVCVSYLRHISASSLFSQSPILSYPSISTGTYAVNGTAGKGLIVRAAPSISAQRLACLAENQYAEVIDGVVTNGYTKVRYRFYGTTAEGWVHTAYISFLNANPLESNTEKVAHPTGLYVVRVSSSLNLRSSAAKAYNVIGSLSNGDYVVVQNGYVFNNFIYVYTKHGFGWVSPDYIYYVSSSMSLPNNSIATGPYTVNVGSGHRLNVRTGAGTGYASLGLLNNGTSITVTNGTVTNGFVYASTPLGNGYVYTGYIKAGGSGYSGSSGSTSTIATGTYTVTIRNNVLNLRGGPGQSYSVLAKLANGTKVTVDAGTVTNGFVHVITPYGSGYVSTSYITYGSSSGASGGSYTGGVTSGATFRIYNTRGKGLNVRSGPGTGYSVICTLPEGATVTTIDSTLSNGFIHVAFNFNGYGTGYVSYSYVH